MTDAENEDDPAVLANTPLQAKPLLHNLVEAVDLDKTEFMCFKQEREIFPFNVIIKVMSTYAWQMGTLPLTGYLFYGKLNYLKK